ncbi:MAG: ATP-binding protein [Candidatus Brocadiae bacterium]|nr:ATP-binding protein [Candidatus Brocadiia bacterium]
MRYALRSLGPELLKAAGRFPALILTGPRRAGKTTLLRHLFPRATHVLLEDPDVVARFRADPSGFLDDLRLPVILDEIQNLPILFNYIRARIDAHPRLRGRWLITGSQEAPLMKGVTESMAGRAAVFSLLPLSHEESPRVSPHLGGYPEVLSSPAASESWFRSYIQTYLERDVRAVSSIRDLATFRRFLALVASRCGTLLNRTDIAAPLGVSVPTITEWLGILEVTGQIALIPPFYENFGKRLVKSPRIYFVDSGLACHLLGITSAAALKVSPFRGAIFESYVASEILKYRLNRGRSRNLYCFRDQQGLEVDFVVDLGNRKLLLLEAKATRTPRPDLARSLAALAKSVRPHDCRPYLVHSAGGEAAKPASLLPGVRSVGVDALGSILEGW